MGGCGVCGRTLWLPSPSPIERQDARGLGRDGQRDYELVDVRPRILQLTTKQDSCLSAFLDEAGGGLTDLHSAGHGPITRVVDREVDWPPTVASDLLTGTSRPCAARPGIASPQER